MVAAAALDEYELTRPWEIAVVMGAKIMNEIRSFIASDDRIISLTGMGLLLSLAFGSTETATRFCILAGNNSLIVRIGVVDTCCVLIRPSLLISESEAEFIIQGIKAALHDL